MRPITLALLLTGFQAAPALAVSFADDTFDLANYGPPLMYATDPGVSGDVQQSTIGNPGNSIQFHLTFPAGINEAYQGLLHNGWTYDPASQGALASVSFAADKLIHQDSDITLTGSNIRLLLSQGGNYYIAATPVAVGFDVWEHGAGLLAAADFAYFNFTTGVYDDTLHPDFNSGSMQFGLANYYGLELTGTLNLDTYYDNLSIGLNGVPEPSSLLLLWAGMVGLGMTRKKV